MLMMILIRRLYIYYFKVIEDCLETILIEIRVKNRKIQIGCIYRVPNIDICWLNEIHRNIIKRLYLASLI